MRLGCLSFLNNLISFCNEADPSFSKATAFAKALMADFCFLLRSSARYTFAKLPCPIFLIGLKKSWKFFLAT